MKKTFVYLSFMALFIACEEEFDADLEGVEAKLVVEAELEENAYVAVKLSQSTDYFSQLAIPTIDNAAISLENLNDGRKEMLQPQGEGLYLGTSILGEAQTSYRLVIDYAGEQYQATSTLYPSVNISDVAFNDFSRGGPFGGDDSEDGFIILSSFNSVGDEVFYRVEYDLADSTEANGYYLVDAGKAGQTLSFGTPQVTVKKSETFSMRIRSLDQGTYTYFSGLAELSGSGFGGGPGGSATPFNPISNFEPSILGYFAASSYTQLDTIAPN